MKEHKTPAKYLPPDWSTNVETDYETVKAALIDWALWRGEAIRYADADDNWAIGEVEKGSGAEFAIAALDRLVSNTDTERQ